jgi:hypothetical protein
MNCVKLVLAQAKFKRCVTYPANGEHGIVGPDFLGTSMTTTTVGDKNNDTSDQRDACHGKNELLGPGAGVLSPRGHLALIRQSLGSVEDCKRSREHGKDDKRAAKVNTTERKLGQADSGLDFLSMCQ